MVTSGTMDLSNVELEGSSALKERERASWKRYYFRLVCSSRVYMVVSLDLGNH
jgi:hypothetical protein